MKSYVTIDQYITQFPPDIQKKLNQIRELIRKNAPGAEEAISYGIPTFKLSGNLIHFAAFKQHLSLFPGAAGVKAFEDRLSGYEISKGTIQFPMDKPIPSKLITEIVRFRVLQNMEKAGTDFFLQLSEPAQRALKDKGITDIKKLAKFTEAEIAELHGMGPSSLPKLRKALAERNLSFKKTK